MTNCCNCVDKFRKITNSWTINETRENEKRKAKRVHYPLRHGQKTSEQRCCQRNVDFLERWRGVMMNLVAASALATALVLKNPPHPSRVYICAPGAASPLEENVSWRRGSAHSRTITANLSSPLLARPQQNNLRASFYPSLDVFAESGWLWLLA